MDNAKRMVLVKKMLECKPMLHFQTKQDLSSKGPTEQAVKSFWNKQIESMTDNPMILEDVKAKYYAQNLSGFPRTKRKLTEES
jgi:hypothetical protein